MVKRSWCHLIFVKHSGPVMELCAKCIRFKWVFRSWLPNSNPRVVNFQYHWFLPWAEVPGLDSGHVISNLKSQFITVHELIGKRQKRLRKKNHWCFRRRSSNHLSFEVWVSGGGHYLVAITPDTNVSCYFCLFGPFHVFLTHSAVQFSSVFVKLWAFSNSWTISETACGFLLSWKMTGSIAKSSVYTVALPSPPFL